ncbi:MAG: bifunctional NADP-dependent methylenetetrahydromethanopterin dehydrogenase/methylenetetrahydrofolate dehydrogenase, partial [Blastopirellula sp.]
MALSKILLQLDPDSQTSTFDSVVAIDAGVDQLLRHAGVLPEEVRNLIYGLIFTRGVLDLKSSAVFI